jgi:hypothetical protein
VPRWRLYPIMVVRFDVSRKYEETLTFSLTSDMQSIVTDEEGEDTIDLTLSSNELTSPIDPGDAMPIGDVFRRTFFSQSRGVQSIEYLISLARARLMARARTVTIDFEIDFLEGIEAGISLRKDCVITNSELPGGTATGKLTAYRFALDGDSGNATCALQIACAIGKGNTVAAVPGEPTWAEEDYAGADYQVFTNQWVVPIAGEVRYTPILGAPPNDDGVALGSLSGTGVIKSLIKENGWGAQEAAIGTHAKEPSEVLDRLAEVPTRFKLKLIPATGGPFHTDFPLTVSELMIPKQIDLEAPSA